MLVKPNSIPGDLDREGPLRRHYWHLADGSPGPRFGLEQLKVEPVHSKRQHSDGEVLTARKETSFVVMEGAAGLGEQPKRRSESPVDEVVALLPRPEGWATDADAEEEEAVRSGNDTGLLQRVVRVQIEAVHEQAGGGRRVIGPDGNLDGFLVTREVFCSGAVGAFADVATGVQEDPGPTRG
jgi:hypothetical protein